MELKLTFQRAGGASTTDLLVDADASATVGQLADAIATRDPDSAHHHPDGGLTVRVEGPGSPRSLPADQILPEASLRSGDRISLQPAGGAYAAGGDVRHGAATLLVAEGPDQGARFELGHGSSQAGREAGSEVCLTDPMVSKRHARFNVTDVVEVLDLGSVNGVVVDGVPVERALLRPGDTVLLGDTLLTVDAVRAVGGADAGGPVVPFNRSPYLDPVYEGDQVRAPEPPPPPQPQRFPALAMVGPFLFGLILYVFTRNIISLVFMGLSPVMMLGAYFEGRRVARLATRDAVDQYRAALTHLGVRLGEMQRVEGDLRRRSHPQTAAVVQAAAELGAPLWARRPDRHGFLDVGLGRGSLPSRVEVEEPSGNNGLPELAVELRATLDRFRLVHDVPVVAPLSTCGVLGIAGSLDASLGVARSVVTQIAGLHSPTEVVIGGLLSNEAVAHWDWLKWLPHTSPPAPPVDGSLLAVGTQPAMVLLASLRDLISRRAEAARAIHDDGARPPTAVVVVVDGAVPVDRSLLLELAERGPAHGVHCVWVARTVAELPAAATCFVDHDVATGQTTVGYVDGGLAVFPVAAETLTGSEVVAFARGLAPVVDAAARASDGDLPARVSFLDQVGLEVAEVPDAVVERWRLSDSLPSRPGTVKPRRKAGPLHGIIGATAHGPIQLDLRAHGPHALVGGTTGAGKSEFLQSWILGLATNHSPARLTFLFVDYKGGAAFSECVTLPHSVGMVTDLTPHLVSRALTSLNAELHRREQILSRKKAKDVLDLERVHDPDTPPSLVIVVDEFAALVAEVPEFVDGVVNVAQRGRSLGLHLILATQRPAGVIKDNLRANTNLRVALRMADEADSTDVVGVPVAAGFDPAVPGRGIAKLGPGRLSGFQAAYVGGWTTAEPPPAQLGVWAFDVGALVEWPEPDEPGLPAPVVDLGPNDLHRLVATVVAAADQAEIPAPRRPWLPELADTYELGRNPTSADDLRLLSRTDERLIFGVLDDPGRQAQVPVAFAPDVDGNMAVIGTGGSGKSAFLRTLSVAAALSTRGGSCHVYGLDFASRGLDMLSPLPNVGSIVTGDDEERVTRLLRTLRSVVDDRLDRYGAARADSITAYRRMHPDCDDARILLLVDGYPAFRQDYEGFGRLAVYDLFQSIATDGRQAGVHVVVAADRIAAVPSALASVIQKRLVLRLAGENEYAMAGVPAAAFPAGTPPGRGFFDEREVQVAVLGGTPNTARQAAAINRLAAAASERGTRAAEPVRSLPVVVPLDEIEPVPTSGGRVAVGIADSTLAPVGFALDGPLVVVGPPKSGKSTTLVTIAQAARRADPDLQLLYVGQGTSPAYGALAWDHEVTPGPDLAEQCRNLREKLAGPATGGDGSGARVLTVVDDAPRVADWGDADAVADLVEALVRADLPVIADGDTGAMNSSWGLLQVLKARRCGIALVPDQFDGDAIFKTTFPKLARRDFPPGRGLYVENGQLERVQMALPLGVRA